MSFSRDQLGPPTPARTTDRIYRKVRLEGSRHDGIVRYDPVLVDLVEDVDGYIVAWLDRQAQALGDRALRGRLFSPADVPLP